MNRRDLDAIELGRRVAMYLVLDNEMSNGVRHCAIANRADHASKDRSRD